jgi:hypothetical protein
MRGSAQAFNRKTRALRESLLRESPSKLNEDLNRPMEEILRGEEERE